MLRTIPTLLLCSLFLLAESRGQEVSVPRQLRKLPVIKPDVEPPPEESAKSVPESEPAATGEDQPAKDEPLKTPVVSEPAVNSQAEKIQSTKVKPPKESGATSDAEKARSLKTETRKEPPARETAKPSLANARPEKPQSMKTATAAASVAREAVASSSAEKSQTVKLETTKISHAQETTVNVQLFNGPMETASTKLADGFDFPVGKPDAEGYYKARGFRSGGHMGEDWNCVRGGDTDLKDPIYSIGDGIVVFARDVHLGWGNVVIVRHGYKENGSVKYVDALYGHLHSVKVKRGQRVARGQQIGTMGTAHGQYDAHLHFEIRKNIEIGMSKSKFQKNFTNYHDPSQFIASHRRLSGGGASFRVAINTFTHDGAYNFDRAPNFSARKRSTAESSTALRRALSSTTASNSD